MNAAEVDVSKLPPPADREVSFSTDIQPLLERSCLRCHGAERARSGFRLDNQESALAGGDNGVDVIPGDSAGSPLIHYVARLDEDMAMPPDGQGEPLSAEEVGLLRAWIDQGARWSDQPAGPRFSFSITPALQFITVSGNEARFREHMWMHEGWGGGASDFSLKYDLDPRTRVELDARAIAGNRDYRFSTRVERDDVGWARFAYREFTRFYDDTGGYYAPFGRDVIPRLGEDLELRHHHATLEFGLELPEWPRIRLVYDLRIRDGTESTLHWGAITRDNVTRNIFPGSKRVDETTHLITLDLQYDWNGLIISDQAQFEWHNQDNERYLYEFPEFDIGKIVTDRQDYWRGANVLRIERQVRDWLYLSGGYLYSHLKDTGGFNLESFFPSDPSLPPTLELATDSLTLRRRSHVINGNAMIGPWENLHFYAGLQAEWTRQEGLATGRDLLASIGRRYDSNLDRAVTEENFGLRYSGIPHTIIFAETRFQQESYSHFEEGFLDETQEFLRDTDATGDLKEYEVGFTFSPWRRSSLMAKYRHRERDNDYDHLRDVDVIYSGNGYPAFIRARDTRTDEVEARLVIQPLRWLKATFKYVVAATDFDTVTEDWEDIRTTPPSTVQGGRIFAGEYDSHILSASFVFTPWTRFHLASTVSWNPSRSISGVNDDQLVVPYEGDIWNVLNSATLIVDEKTDLTATYLFSHADFEQDNQDFALPLGVSYTRHAATVGILRRMKDNRSVRLEYGFFTYDEPTLGGAADYTAHGLFASFHVPWL